MNNDMIEIAVIGLGRFGKFWGEHLSKYYNVYGFVYVYVYLLCRICCPAVGKWRTFLTQNFVLFVLDIFLNFVNELLLVFLFGLQVGN